MFARCRGAPRHELTRPKAHRIQSARKLKCLTISSPFLRIWWDKLMVADLWLLGPIWRAI